jgi:L-amino acid N-acyltransferase YncA
MLLALAVAVDHRGGDGKMADEALGRVLVDVLRREGRRATLVLARIHQENKPSARMAARRGFDPLHDFIPPDDPALEYWRALIET